VTEEEGAKALTTVFVDERAATRRLKKARLVVAGGPDAGKELVIARERVTIGRSVICDLTLQDQAVSGTHFEIVASERGFLLRDLGSTNGTFAGDYQVREVWLQPGNTIRIGQSELRFEPERGTVDIALSRSDSFHGILGRAVRMREIFAILEKVAPTDLTILVRGETGTGKERVARALHRASRRHEGPLVVQDCGAIPRDLIESTLFGHERGAFTGATERRRGSFERADGGTIFLDEIGELDLDLQPKLLRVLESREIKRVGGARQLPVDVRVVAATNRDLRQMVNEGTFREDLYYRLSVIQIEMPPLRERADDVELLAEHFLKEVSERRFPDGEARLSLSPGALRRLKTYPWPGNIRELKNTVERAGSLSDGPVLGVGDITPSFQRTHVASAGAMRGDLDAARFVEEGLPFKEAKQKVLDVFEAAYLRVLLARHEQNITRSAQAAGLTRYHLRELAKRHGVRDE
jgi:transcriptional regulator with GAF, ATPase, and Fis domain